MSDKKKKKNKLSPTLSGRYKVSGGKLSDKDIAAQIRADIRAGLKLEGNNYSFEPYVRGSASKGPKGKPRTSVDRMGVEAEYKPTKDSFIRARGSTNPKRTNKHFGIEAGVTFKEGGMIIKDRQYLKGK
tara:strand:+ start:137 stop:523 length:387 start_codon:yes stop_codon:yes gene_type:complete